MPAIPRLTRWTSLVLLPFLVAAAVVVSALTAPAANAGVDRAVDIARNQIGDRYRYGAEGPHRFDCSGLIYYSYRRAGYGKMPRSSRAQAAWLRPIKKRNMRRGDLMYFASGGSVYHAGIFVGWKRGRALMIDAGSSGGEVRRRHPWTKSWFGRTIRRR